MRNPFSRRRHGRPFQPVPEREVDAELSFHLEQRIRDYVAQGMDPAAARAAALERFGDIGNVRRECEQMLEEHHRAAARRDWFEDLRQDLKFGVRGALRSPLFSLLAILTLALGIGANAAVFGVVKSVLLDSLPYSSAGRLMRIYGRSLDGSHERGPLSAGTAADITQRQQSFAGMARTLGIPLRSGRGFDARDASGPPVIVISEGMARQFWPRGGALGAQLRMGPDPNATPFTVVGIVGDVRNDPAQPDAEPITYSSSRQSVEPSRQVLVKTRGNPLAVAGALRREMAALDPGVPFRDAVTLHEYVSDKLTMRRLPVVLMSGFGILALLLASVGVYAMFAAMATAREREFGVRMALGSSRRAIAGLVLRQGAPWMAAGLAVGAVGVVVIVRFVRGLLFGVSQHDPLTFAAVVLVLLVFAAIALLLPVRRATHVDPISVLR